MPRHRCAGVGSPAGSCPTKAFGRWSSEDNQYYCQDCELIRFGPLPNRTSRQSPSVSIGSSNATRHSPSVCTSSSSNPPRHKPSTRTSAINDARQVSSPASSAVTAVSLGSGPIKASSPTVTNGQPLKMKRGRIVAGYLLVRELFQSSHQPRVLAVFVKDLSESS